MNVVYLAPFEKSYPTLRSALNGRTVPEHTPGKWQTLLRRRQVSLHRAVLRGIEQTRRELVRDFTRELIRLALWSQHHEYPPDLLTGIRSVSVDGFCALAGRRIHYGDRIMVEYVYEPRIRQTQPSDADWIELSILARFRFIAEPSPVVDERLTR